MRIVKIGVVDLMIWWKGIDTIALFPPVSIFHLYERRGEGKWAYSETLDIAILIVNRNENKINVICSLEFNLLNAKSPRSKRT